MKIITNIKNKFKKMSILKRVLFFLTLLLLILISTFYFFIYQEDIWSNRGLDEIRDFWTKEVTPKISKIKKDVYSSNDLNYSNNQVKKILHCYLNHGKTTLTSSLNDENYQNIYSQLGFSQQNPGINFSSKLIEIDYVVDSSLKETIKVAKTKLTNSKRDLIIKNFIEAIDKRLPIFLYVEQKNGKLHPAGNKYADGGLSRSDVGPAYDYGNYSAYYDQINDLKYIFLDNGTIVGGDNPTNEINWFNYVNIGTTENGLLDGKNLIKENAIEGLDNSIGWIVFNNLNKKNNISEYQAFGIIDFNGYKNISADFDEGEGNYFDLCDCYDFPPFTSKTNKEGIHYGISTDKIEGIFIDPTNFSVINFHPNYFMIPGLNRAYISYYGSNSNYGDYEVNNDNLVIHFKYLNYTNNFKILKDENGKIIGIKAIQFNTNFMKIK